MATKYDITAEAKHDVVELIWGHLNHDLKMDIEVGFATCDYDVEMFIDWLGQKSPQLKHDFVVYLEENWKSFPIFTVDTNQYWGVIDDITKFKRFIQLNNSTNDATNFLKACRSTEKISSFGLYREHKHEPNLYDWLKSVGFNFKQLKDKA